MSCLSGDKRSVSSCSDREAQTDGNEGDYSCYAAIGHGTAQSFSDIVLCGNGQKL